jgi:ABC-type anion transport system duplicated permease subunit
MRAGSRVVAVVLAAAVWIYAGMSLATRPATQQADLPLVLEVATSAAVAVAD